MNLNPFKPDDRVVLKTGGEPMVVERVKGDQVGSELGTQRACELLQLLDGQV